MSSRRSPLTDHTAVELVALSDGGWIACDQACDQNDPARIIAHLEARGNDVCVTWVRDRRDGCVYTTMGEALDAMACSLHPELSAGRSRALTARCFYSF